MAREFFRKPGRRRETFEHSSRRSATVMKSSPTVHQLAERKTTAFHLPGCGLQCLSLGTMELIFSLKQKGSAASISDLLGSLVRTNSESLIGVRIPGHPDDLSKASPLALGFSSTSTPTLRQYAIPSGSDAMSLLSTLLTSGRPGSLELLCWLINIAMAALRHPLRTFASDAPLGWARECVILLMHAGPRCAHRHALAAPWFCRSASTWSAKEEHSYVHPRRRTTSQKNSRGSSAAWR